MTPEDPSRPPAYRALLHSRNLAVDDVLVEALPEMESAYRPMALTVLLARDQEPALARLVAGLCHYDQDLRELITRHADRLATGARACIADERFEVRRAAIELIRASGNCRLADLLSETLTRSCPRTTELAAHALVELLERNHGSAYRWSSSRTRRAVSHLDHLLMALRKGLSAWGLHRRREILGAAVRFSSLVEDTILKVAGDPRTGTYRAFTELAAMSVDPGIAGFCLRGLRCPQLQDAIVNRFATSRDAAFGAATVGEAWLLADAGIRKAYVRIRSAPFLERHSVSLARQGPRAARAVVRLILAGGLRPERKLALFRQLAFGVSPDAGRAAIWALIDRNFEGSDEVLRTVAARGPSSLSLVADIELRRRSGKPLAASRSEATGHGALDASPYLEAPTPRSAFEQLWEEFDSLPTEYRQTIGGAVMQATSDFEQLLRTKWSDSLPADRVRSLRIMGELGLTTRFEQEVYSSASDADSVVRSAAVSLLGALDTPESLRILRGAIDDPDDRVQANAIEALAVLNVADLTAHVVPKLNAESSRVRANAVTVLLQMRVRDAAVHLINMLASPASADRVSALWVVERMRLASVMSRLYRIAGSDPDPRVKRRARRVLDRLDAGGDRQTVRGAAAGEASS